MKRGERPIVAACSRRTSRQKAWKVPTKSALARSLPTSAATRSRISRAARFVKVTASTLSGGTPRSSSQAMR